MATVWSKKLEVKVSEMQYESMQDEDLEKLVNDCEEIDYAGLLSQLLAEKGWKGFCVVELD